MYFCERFEPRSHFKSRLSLTTAQVVETSVTVNNNSRIHDYIYPDDQTQLTFDTYFSPYSIFQFLSAFMAPFNKMSSASATASLLVTAKL